MTRSDSEIAKDVSRDADPSRSMTTKVARAKARAISSWMVRSPPEATTVRRGGVPPSADQRISRPAGSASMRMTSVPSASSVARTIADVVLPAPPLEEAKEMTGIVRASR